MFLLWFLLSFVVLLKADTLTAGTGTTDYAVSGTVNGQNNAVIPDKILPGIAEQWNQTIGLGGNDSLKIVVAFKAARGLHLIYNITIGWITNQYFVPIEIESDKTLIEFIDPEICGTCYLPLNSSKTQYFHFSSNVSDSNSKRVIMKVSNINRLMKDMNIYIKFNYTGIYNSSVKFAYFRIDGIPFQTKRPTMTPTFRPTLNPSIQPSIIPSLNPTLIPTKNPTLLPTTQPTGVPTYYQIRNQTTRILGVDSYQKYSTNVIDLRTRNMTYGSDYKLPPREDGSIPPWCITCLLAWADIDASITIVGCGNIDYNDSSFFDLGNAFWACDNGTWILRTSGRLVQFQQTYGRLEVWEEDANELKWLHWKFEFNWWTNKCKWKLDNGTEMDCHYLPLTGSNENTAYFEFTMPKRFGDNRKAPLIVAWFDILNIPYSLKPELNYQYANLTLQNPGEGQQFGLDDVWTNFKPAIIATIALFCCFLAVMMLACFVSGDRKTKYDFMIDSRNLRTTYIHRVDSLIVPSDTLQNRARFSCRRHGPWLLVVLIARLIYMFVFTFTFFYLAFQAINATHFDVLSRYEPFADNRDEQLSNFSRAVEAYYNNETERMDLRVNLTEQYCVNEWTEAVDNNYIIGADNQYQNHSNQMKNPLRFLNQSASDIVLYRYGSTSCSINETSGAKYLERDPVFTTLLNGTQIYYNIEDYPSSSSPRFNELKDFLNDHCSTREWCLGWTYLDATSTMNVSSYYVLSKLALNVINPYSPGVCYIRSSNTGSVFNIKDFNLNFVTNYTSILRNSFLNDYKSQVTSLSTSLNKLWDSLHNIQKNSGQGSILIGNTIFNNDPSETFHIDMNYKGFVNNGTTGNNQVYVDIIVYCPGCPDGNFTNPQLQDVYDYLTSINNSNFSDKFSAAKSNLSDLVQVLPPLIALPDLPSIDFPFSISLPIDISVVLGLSLTLDFLLLIYRWYRTAGIVARIVRGKDVDVSLSYLQIQKASLRCCTGRSIVDQCLNCVMWCHDKLFYLNYNLLKLCYWLWFLFRIALVAMVILMAYILADQILTVSFIEQLGTFNLMTAALGAQRSVRNQVIATKAKTQNEFSLQIMQRQRDKYAQDKNEDAYNQNKAESKRVDEWNFYFCSAWTGYQGTPRDIATALLDSEWTINDYKIFSSNNYYNINNTNISNVHYLFDGNKSTGWTPFLFNDTNNKWFAIEFKLPKIWMSNEVQTDWIVSQIVFDWNVKVQYQSVDMVISSKLLLNDSYIPYFYTFQAPSYIINGFENNIFLDFNDTQYLLINFTNVNNNFGGNGMSINSLKLYGHAPKNKIVCPKVIFYYWSFNADDTEIAQCPYITPIHGLMYRGFVRSWLNDQLLEGHRPFILAVRNIGLSPFFLLLLAIGVLFVAYLFCFIVEWFLMKLDLYRENAYARVPLVTTNDPNYDPTQHDIGGGAGIGGEDYDEDDINNHESNRTNNNNYSKFSANVEQKNQIPQANVIEMGLVHEVNFKNKIRRPSQNEQNTDTVYDENNASYLPPPDPNQ